MGLVYSDFVLIISVDAASINVVYGTKIITYIVIVLIYITANIYVGQADYSQISPKGEIQKTKKWLHSLQKCII